jgi:hypothetical protein
VTLKAPSLDNQMPLTPFIGNENFNPGYMARGLHLWPKSGVNLPWRHSQDYTTDASAFPAIDLADEAFSYAPTAEAASKIDDAGFPLFVRAGHASA